MAETRIQGSTTFDLYIRDLKGWEPLSTEQEVEVFKQIHQGDQEARDKLVSSNLRFVVKIAKAYVNRGLPLSDLIGAGNIGLITAVERFDETRGFKFISYAVWWIRQAIQQSLAEDPRMIRLPMNRINLLTRISKISQTLRQRFLRLHT